MKIADSGININTNPVNSGLIIYIDISVKKIINGSLIINSKTVKKELSISKTSDEILATISPFFFSE